MDETPNLGLPYIMAAQSQKHVTHNEAIRALDAIVQLSVLDRSLDTPPGSPAEGARYIIAASPTGAWSEHAGEVAAWQDGAWMFYSPLEGWIAWVADEDLALVWSGSAWTALTTGGGGGDGDFSTLGVNAVADTTNRLAVAADATLLSHDGDDHRLKINKAAAGDTGSLLYQTGFSGRAELGLAGDDDFHFKVSPDGSTWKEAILIDRTTGGVSFPNTAISGGRTLLTANRTYYVRADGSDSNNGLANTSGSAFATIQKAYDVITSTLDLGGKTITIQVGSGTFTSGLSVIQPWTGGGAVVLQGDVSTPSNVVISTTGASCIGTTVPVPGALTVQGFELRTTTAGCGIDHAGGGVVIAGAMRYGACVNAQIQVASGCYVGIVGDYVISGNAGQHWNALHGGFIQCDFRTITLSGVPSFSSSFAFATNTGKIEAIANTFAGPGGMFTVTIASPAVFTKTGHGLVAGTPVVFSTTGALPTGLVGGTTYYVIATGLTADNFRVATTVGGSAVNTSGSQSGAHTLTSGAIGTNYSATANGVINTGAAGANYFPGNAAGATATGGQYT